MHDPPDAADVALGGRVDDPHQGLAVRGAGHHDRHADSAPEHRELLPDTLLEVAEGVDGEIVLVDDVPLLVVEVCNPLAEPPRKPDHVGLRTGPPEVLGDVAGGVREVMDLQARTDHGDLGPDEGRFGHLARKRLCNLPYQADVVPRHERLKHDVLGHNVLLHDVAPEVVDQVRNLVVPVDASLVGHRHQRRHNVSPIFAKIGATTVSTMSPGRVSSLAT